MYYAVSIKSIVDFNSILFLPFSFTKVDRKWLTQ